MPKPAHHHFRLSSLKQLVLLSFLAVVIPFALLIFYASMALVEQSAQGRVLAEQALDVSRRGQHLERLAEDITRSALQHHILTEPEIRQRLQSYIKTYRQQFYTHAITLNNPSLTQAITLLLNTIERLTPNQEKYLPGLTREMNAEVDGVLDKRLQALNSVAQASQKNLSVLAISIFLGEAILILFLSLSITRPVHRIAARIQALGTGVKYKGAEVMGPSELVALEEQLDWLSSRLAEVEKEKQRFLRHMSHELKTPLTTLREGSDLLADQISGPLNKNQMDVVELLQKGARQLQSLIEQLLDYNRLLQDEPVQFHAVKLKPLLNEALEPYRLMLNQKHMSLSLPEEDYEWITDRAMLIRILSNLISNAALYGSENGKLILRVYKKSDNFFIEVENQGPLIPAKDIPLLFEPFYQGQNRRLGAIKGSGIGLSIVRDAADAIGASVKLFKNKNNWVGFRICLTITEKASHA